MANRLFRHPRCPVCLSPAFVIGPVPATDSEDAFCELSCLTPTHGPQMVSKSYLDDDENGWAYFDGTEGSGSRQDELYAAWMNVSDDEPEVRP